MTDRRATPLLALVALIVSLSLALATIALRALVGSVSLGSQSDYWLFNTVVAIIFPLAGVVILRRQRRHLVGWLFIAGGFGNGVTGVGTMYSALALHTFSGRLQGGAAAWWVASWAWILLPIAFVFTLIVFPNGRPLTARWHPLLATAALGGGAWIAGAATTSWDEQGLPRWIHGDNPLRLAPGPAIEAGGLLLVLVTLVAAAVSILLRFRRSRGEERAQLKWMALAAFPLAATFVSFFFGDIGGALVSAIAVVLFAAPIAVGILRYRLYDVDVVISRTLVYTALAGFITAFYVAIVVGIGTVIGQGGRPNLPLSILATALVAVAFQPLRERLQRVANRLVYGRRATPYEVLSDLAARMAETVARDELLPRMARALAEGTGATHATVWLRHNGEMRPLASWPGQEHELPSIALDGELGFAGSDVTAPVRHQGQLLGALTLRKRPGEPLTPLEEKLLSDLASQTGLVLRNVALTDELIARLDELRASRQRLVSAQDAERRRLERNLHDGAQQNLVALKVKVSLAERMA
ncbi:MAG TPA: histidine kinase, partial [Candidatus Sulfotelmatobacter sp.]|nr:histidine kinase [Candidatus Sulfotelmatobacter sp.]